MLTYCDTDCIQEVIYQRLNVEKVRSRLELSEIDLNLDDEGDDIKFNFDNLLKFYLNNDKAIDDETSFGQKNQTIRVLLENLIYLRSQSFKSDKKRLALFVKISNELAKSDASILFSYMLEMSEENMGVLENLDNIEFNSSIAYEFLLYLFGMNIVAHDYSQKIGYFKPSAINEYILGISWAL